MAKELFSFEYRFRSKGADAEWLPYSKAFGKRAAAERRATQEAEIYAGLGGHVETRIVSLDSDGRKGRVAVAK